MRVSKNTDMNSLRLIEFLMRLDRKMITQLWHHACSCCEKDESASISFLVLRKTTFDTNLKLLQSRLPNMHGQMEVWMIYQLRMFLPMCSIFNAHNSESRFLLNPMKLLLCSFVLKTPLSCEHCHLSSPSLLSPSTLWSQSWC